MAHITIVEAEKDMAEATRQAFAGTEVAILDDWAQVGRAALAVPATTNGELIFDLPPRAFDADLAARVRAYFRESGPVRIGEYRSFVTGNLLGFPLLIVVPVAEQVGTPMLGTSNVHLAFGAALRAWQEHEVDAIAIQSMRTVLPSGQFDFCAQQMRLAFGLAQEAE